VLETLCLLAELYLELFDHATRAFLKVLRLYRKTSARPR
jgi:hypothetical protein